MYCSIEHCGVGQHHDVLGGACEGLEGLLECIHLSANFHSQSSRETPSANIHDMDLDILPMVPWSVTA